MARMFQGFGDAACTTVSFAILRDCFAGKDLVKAIASLGMVMMFAPIVAPFVGAYIISHTGKWQDIFHFLTGYGVFLLLCTFITPETNHKRNLLANIYRSYRTHLVNRSFMMLSIASALSFAALFSFIGSSSIIYIGIYHTTSFHYAIFFGLNATAIILANFALKHLIDKISLLKIQIISLSIATIILICGLVTSYLTTINLSVFICIMWLVTFSSAITSNAMTSEAVSDIHESFGAATSIATFVKFALAGLANYLMTLVHYTELSKIMFVQQLSIVLIIITVYYYIEYH
jgi:DHA1 family bicyclomycin/chloramphenicol resistance-like MFS transporter